ncbi:SsgA family sporulation/cell division regulator [Streptomyces sp. NPDC001595]|uniref:SsgA family sporulation/cell division regulator n=1 Tax=Streptomyces sp. NPDC001532 TaxID=3154520 RepID=UPI00332764B7
MYDPASPPNGARAARYARCHRISLSAVVITGTGGVPLDVRFGYDSADPFAVRLDFPLGAGETPSWVLSRDLLSRGLVSPSGDGDVRVWPPCRCHSSTMIRIRLRNTRSAAVLYVPAAELGGWLRNTYLAVPPGEESVHAALDRALEQLLEEG